MNLTGNGKPVQKVRKGWIKKFPGGKGENCCPSFYYLRDGIGCPFDCKWCYLTRFEGSYFDHEAGAEYNPDFETLYSELRQFLARKQPQSLILGEVTDAWGWAFKADILERNLQLIEMFRGTPHTLIMLTKSGKVHEYLEDVDPATNVILSWSVNSGPAAEYYEMGTAQLDQRWRDAFKCNEAGWRVRLRLDPMVPVAWNDQDWQIAYRAACHQIEYIQPELVTVGSWRPRRQDKMMKTVDPELRAMLEPGPDGRLRLKNRMDMYRFVFRELAGKVPVGLCKEELDVQQALYSEFGISQQHCNCLAFPV